MSHSKGIAALSHYRQKIGTSRHLHMCPATTVSSLSNGRMVNGDKKSFILSLLRYSQLFFRMIKSLRKEAQITPLPM